MKKLKRINLEFEPTLLYFKNNLDSLNELSKHLLEIVNFYKGKFFTLLPDEADMKTLYNFTNAILPPNPLREHFINGKRSTYSEITSLDSELCEFILNQQKNNSKLNCIMDDALRSSNSPFKFPEIKKLTLSCLDERYYLIRNAETTFELLLKCMKSSNALWHSLAILTETDVIANDQKLTIDDLTNVCQNITMIIIAAYDCEGYVLWEKQ